MTGLHKPIGFGINPVVARGLYLAGVFDAGLSVQFVKRNKKNYRIQINKTSTDIETVVGLYAESGELGNIIQTARGVRWAMEAIDDVRSFLTLIEPYVKIRREEFNCLYTFATQGHMMKESERRHLYETYKALRAERFDRNERKEATRIVDPVEYNGD